MQSFSATEPAGKAGRGRGESQKGGKRPKRGAASGRSIKQKGGWARKGAAKKRTGKNTAANVAPSSAGGDHSAAKPRAGSWGGRGVGVRTDARQGAKNQCGVGDKKGSAGAGWLRMQKKKEAQGQWVGPPGQGAFEQKNTRRSRARQTKPVQSSGKPWNRQPRKVQGAKRA